MVLMLVTSSSDDFWDAIKDSPPEMAEIYKFAGIILVDSASLRELAHRTKLLEAMLDKWEIMFFPLEEVLRGNLFYNLVTGQGTQRAFRLSGSFLSGGGNQETWDAMSNFSRRAAEEIWAKYEEAGKVALAGEAPWGAALGDTCSHVESIVIYDQLDPESVQAVRDIILECDEKLRKWHLGMGLLEGCLSRGARAEAGRTLLPGLHEIRETGQEALRSQPGR
jgi:hypothetical protein